MAICRQSKRANLITLKPHWGSRESRNPGTSMRTWTTDLVECVRKSVPRIRWLGCLIGMLLNNYPSTKREGYARLQDCLVDYKDQVVRKSLEGNLSACLQWQQYCCKVYNSNIVLYCDYMLKGNAGQEAFFPHWKIELERLIYIRAYQGRSEHLPIE